MNAIQLATKLNAVWLIQQTENDDKEPITVRRDVKSLFIHYLSSLPAPPLTSAIDYVVDNASLCEVDSSTHGHGAATEQMYAISRGLGQLVVDDLVQSQIGPEEFDQPNDYEDLVNHLLAAFSLPPVTDLQMAFIRQNAMPAASVVDQFIAHKGQHERVLNAILRAATEHGQDDDPDHEVGDLQAALSIILPLLTPEQLNVAINQLHASQDGFSDVYNT